MPQKPKEELVVAGVRAVLLEMIGGLTPIRKETVFDALRRELARQGAKVSRATYFKYVEDGTPLAADIASAKAEQQKLATQTPAQRREAKLQEAHDEIRRLTEANRALLLERAAFFEYLQELGVSAAIVQAAAAHTLNKIPKQRGFKKRPGGSGGRQGRRGRR